MLSKFRQHRLLFAWNWKVLFSSFSYFRTQQSSNDYISTLCKQNRFEEALRAFDFIQTNTHFQVTPSSFAHLILACSSLKSLEHGRRIHNHLLRSISASNVILNNHIINMYGKCGSLLHAREVFDTMSERNLVSWTSMIAGYAQNNCEVEAVVLYKDMLRLGLVPDHFALGNIVKACANTKSKELGQQVHGHVIKSVNGFHQIVQNALISMYTKFDCLDSAMAVFERIVMKDLVSWGSIIAGCAQLGYELAALSHFKEMVRLDSYCLNEYIFGSVFSACSSLLQLEYGRQLHGLSLKFGLGRNHISCCSVCDMYAKCGCLNSARKAFYQADGADVVSWNAMIAGYAYSGNIEEAMFFFSNMRQLGMKPDQITLVCVLCACSGCASLHLGRQIHSYIFKMGFDLDAQVCNTVLAMYAKCLDLSDGIKVFEEMSAIRDAVSWNAMITACMQYDELDEVFRLLRTMQVSESRPDQITLGNVLSSCASLATLDLGNQVHGYCVKIGLEFDITVANSLMDMYAKCGELDGARRLFQLMADPDVISWSCLVVGYAQFGCAFEALELFRKMQGLGIKPNHVTFVGVLSACSRVGLVEEALHYYKMLEIEHGIVPTKEHCSCMVDVLARAGQLEEAERFITQMPHEPDIVVWKTLLSACRLHRNVEIGKRAAESIMKLDPMNSAAFILLSNIYASNGSWDEVGKIRKVMRDRGLRKDSGKSWIRIKGRVHDFSAEDHSHIQSDVILKTLEDLFWEMKEAGYAPNLPFSVKCL
ncbi:pentatricopeptide repeat-containing protein At3g53360, mitochondrial [Aristolochia californica]|uniref:pentatricopeptide repeat-containing protein At3g53360, mitochondrial n=1 Tax=Aristolochia californica TaxID=171875 RepID=UPI0035E3971B